MIAVVVETVEEVETFNEIIMFILYSTLNNIFIKICNIILFDTYTNKPLKKFEKNFEKKLNRKTQKIFGAIP